MVWILVLIGVFQACAVPIPPSGGPEDSTPPVLLNSEPADAEVNAKTDRIILYFNERIDERSVFGSLSIFPEFSQPVRIEYKGDRIEVRFPEPLRTNTTYVVSLDTRLRDAHNVALKQPISVAFATGDKLNTGQITGKMVDALRGKPVIGADVFLFPVTESGRAEAENTKPVYRTQTNDSGTFSLSNLREQSYFVLGLRDRNQNKMLDADEPIAVAQEMVTVSDSINALLELPLVLATLDTLSPVIRQVRGTFTDQMLLLFSEVVLLDDTATNNWVLTDSVSGEQYRVHWTYSGPGEREIILRTDSLYGGTKVLSGRGAIADSSNNFMQESTHYFRAGSTDRPGVVTFEGFLPDSSSTRTADGHLLLWPGQAAGVRFGAPLSGSEGATDTPQQHAAADSSKKPPALSWDDLVVVSDTSGSALHIRALTHDGVRYVLADLDQFDEPFQIDVTVSDSTFHESFVHAPADLLGELTGVILDSGERSRIRIELYGNHVPYPLIQSASLQPDGLFRFEELPGGSLYFIRAFIDTNGDNRWTPGQADPFRPTEPIVWYDVAARIRARWETVIPDTLRIPQARARLP